VSGLLGSYTLGRTVAPNRVLFGPHVTNLGRDRSISERHAAYYARRARGGCGVVVTEIASVHESDWPYERAPLASACEEGWAATVAACDDEGTGTIVLAGLGHAGLQGSTAWTQDVLWAPSLVPSVHTAEQPLALGDAEIAALVAGFEHAASVAMSSGCRGVELNCGQHSLLRQFCSGLTNLRDDRYGTERTALLRDVVAAVRGAVGDAVVGLRFCVDELAPWAGITPEDAAAIVVEAAAGIDYVCCVRGSIYTEAATQPDGHEPQGFNRATTSLVSAALRASGSSTLVCAQGSIADVAVGEELLAAGVCDLVEMTRAQIADPDLCHKAASGRERIRPCLLCNQHCMVRDPRNPIVSCCVNPVAGHELDDAALDVEGGERLSREGSEVLVVGAGIAGLEAARLLARRGHAVTLAERSGELGGVLRIAARLPGRARLAALCDWLAAEVDLEGVRVELHRDVDARSLEATTLVVATGGRSARVALRDGDDGSVLHIDAAALADGRRVEGAVVVLDPVGGPIGIGAAELAASEGGSVMLVTPDVVAGSQLSATGDLVAANVRLAGAGIELVRHATPIAIDADAVIVEDRFTGAVSRLGADVCVDAGHRLASEQAWPSNAVVVGDAVAPRGILMAMLEARRAAVGADGAR